MNSEYSNSEPIKLSKSLYTILCHLINIYIHSEKILKSEKRGTPCDDDGKRK